MPNSSATPIKQKALCVGINIFKHLPGAALNGCVNDAKDMAALLKKTRGFKASDIKILTNAQATKKAVMAELNKLAKLAQAGKLDYLVFSFSSHGTQVPDLDNDEPLETAGDLRGQRADEAFCPYDLIAKGDRWDPAHIITDDEFHDLFITIPESCLVEVYLDTCNSGTGLKVIDLLGFVNHPTKPRYVPPPSLRAFQALNTPQSKAKPRSMLRTSDKIARQGAILWSGCRSDQTSADAYFGNRPNGAFTRYYIDAVLANPNASRPAIHKQLKSGLKKAKFTQIPQLEMDATRRKK